MTIEGAECPGDGWVTVPGRTRSAAKGVSDIAMGEQREAPLSHSLQEMKDLEMALKLSMQDNNDIKPQQTLDPFQRTRAPDMPVGLKNVGNSCYVTSIVQSYFVIDKFREIIFALNFPEEPYPAGDIRNVARELQRLLAFLVMSDRKYVDPTDFLNTLVDKDGNCVHTGDQQDPTEFRIFFLEKVQESVDAVLNDAEAQDQAEPMFDIDDAPEVAPKASKRPKEIEKLVTGTFRQVIEAQEADGTPVQSVQETEFSEISLNLEGAGDLYESLDRYMEDTEIENFETPQGHSSAGRKEISLKTVPETLSFQLQRVDFDKKRHVIVKNHSPFEFPKTFCPDRYMSCHRAAVTQLRAHEAELRSSLGDAEAALARLNSFQDTKQSAKNILQSSLSFLRGQRDEKLEPSIQVLMEAFDKVYQEEQELTSRIAALRSKINTLYDDLQAIHYRIHSILVHGGQGSGGHYYSYLYDAANQRWFKYNDSDVTEEPEEVVMKDSRGGFEAKSAYCVLYVQEDCSAVVPSAAAASRQISPLLQADVAQDNEEHAEEKEEWLAEQRRRAEAEMKALAEEQAKVLSNMANLSLASRAPARQPRTAITVTPAAGVLTAEQVGRFEEACALDKLELENSLVTLYGLDLMSFSRFLWSSGSLAFYDVEITNLALRRTLGISVIDHIAMTIPSVKEIMDSFYRPGYDALVQRYDSAVLAWKNCYHGLQCVPHSVMEAVEYFYHAYVNAVRCKMMTEAAEAFLQLFERCAQLTSERGLELWRFDEDIRDGVVTAGNLACRMSILSKSSTAFRDFRKEWSAALVDLGPPSKSSRELREFLEDMNVLLEGRSSSSYRPPQVIQSLNKSVWNCLKGLLTASEAALSISLPKP